MRRVFGGSNLLTSPTRSHVKSIYSNGGVICGPVRRMGQLFAPIHWKQADGADLIKSHKLMLRTGLIRQASSGVYSLLPLGYRALEKITKIIDEEMKLVGGQRVQLPTLQSRELWEKVDRWNTTGSELMRLKDRKGSDFCLAPTHEEMITQLVTNESLSYRQLPLRLYQIGTKFRDELRPKFGLLRGREFTMKDMYSFDVTKEDALDTYEHMKESYKRVCDRLGLKYSVAEADTGTIGGTLSHEFQVISEVGEDIVLRCDSCGYAANVERAKGGPPLLHVDGDTNDKESNASTTTSFYYDYHTSSNDGTCVVRVEAVTYHNRTVNPIKVLQYIHNNNNNKCKLPSGGELYPVFSENKETTSTIDTPSEEDSSFIVYDEDLPEEVLSKKQQKGHIGDVEPEEEEEEEEEEEDIELNNMRGDIREARKGDTCKVDGCGGMLGEHRGIEVGQIFYLGTKYSKGFDTRVALGEGEGDDEGNGETGSSGLVEMGCFGLGVSRLLGAVVETTSDERGLAWPPSVAPYQILILSLVNKKQGRDVSDMLHEGAMEIYRRLEAEPILRGEVVLDDYTHDSTQHKLARASLLGFPYLVILGSSMHKRSLVEVENRRTREKTFLPLEHVMPFIRDAVTSYQSQ